MHCSFGLSFLFSFSFSFHLFKSTVISQTAFLILSRSVRDSLKSIDMVRTRGDLKVQEKYDKEVAKQEKQYNRSKTQLANSQWKAKEDVQRMQHHQALQDAGQPNYYERYKEICKSVS